MVAGDAQAAEVAFKRAVDLDPNYLAAYEQLAGLYAVSERLEQAIDTYEQAVAARPEAAKLHHLLGVLYEMSDQRERAIASYQTAIRYHPNLAESKNNLAYIFAESGENLDRALDLAQEAKALRPDNPNTADTLGWVLYRRGIPSAAISYLKEAEAGTDSTEASLGVIRHHLAQAYDANQQQEMAVQTLSRALTDLDAELESQRQHGSEPSEPAWAGDARAMLVRLQGEG